MKIGQFPLMACFLHGAFQANSGGSVNRDEEINGTPDEWMQAEAWFREYWTLNVDLPRIVNWMGMQADSAYTMYEQDPETDEMKPCLPWVILDRYY